MPYSCARSIKNLKSSKFLQNSTKINNCHQQHSSSFTHSLLSPSRRCRTCAASKTQFKFIPELRSLHVRSVQVVKRGRASSHIFRQPKPSQLHCPPSTRADWALSGNFQIFQTAVTKNRPLMGQLISCELKCSTHGRSFWVMSLNSVNFRAQLLPWVVFFASHVRGVGVFQLKTPPRLPVRA